MSRAQNGRIEAVERGQVTRQGEDMTQRESADPSGAGDGRDTPPAGTGALALVRRAPRLALRGLILVYRYSLSAFMGRQCRYLPTCSEYAEEAVMRHGALAGSVMATARICRCNPWGGHGYDPVPRCLPADARWFRPWRYGVWRTPVAAEEAEAPQPPAGS